MGGGQRDFLSMRGLGAGGGSNVEGESVGVV